MAYEKFHYTLTTGFDAEGEAEKFKLTLPKFDNLPFGLIRKFRALPAAEQFFAILEDILTDEQLENLDKATQKQVSNLFTAWQKDSQVTVGES